MVAEPPGSIIPSAETLRKIVDDKKNSRKKELEEAASFILESIGDFIFRHMDEIIESEQGTTYTLSIDDIRKMCELRSKPLLAPTTLGEFHTVTSIITDTLSDNGYRTHTTAGSESEEVLKAEISISAKLPEEKEEKDRASLKGSVQRGPTTTDVSDKF